MYFNKKLNTSTFYKYLIKRELPLFQFKYDTTLYLCNIPACFNVKTK
jgi:hypothetical protein